MKYIVMEPKSGIILFKGDTELLRQWNPIFSQIHESMIINTVKAMGLEVYEQV